MIAASHLVGQIGSSDLPALGPFRSLAGWELAEDEAGGHWLRIPITEENEKSFAQLPLLHRWTLRGNLLYRKAHQLPERAQPQSLWKPLSESLPFQKIPASLPACPPFPLPLTLVSSSVEVPPVALLTESDFALRWGEQSFAPRLEKLRFSVCENSEVIFLGSPLPPVEGTALYQLGRLLIPNGLALPDYLHHRDVEEAFALRDDEQVLLRPDGSGDRLLEEQLLPCTRAHLRASLAFSHA